jgi:hypothetical protein
MSRVDVKSTIVLAFACGEAEGFAWKIAHLEGAPGLTDDQGALPRLV